MEKKIRRTYIKSLKYKNGKIIIEGHIEVTDSTNVKDYTLLFIGRNSKKEYNLGKMRFFQKKEQTNHIKWFKKTLSLRQIIDKETLEEIFDLYISINDFSEPIKIGNPSFIARHFMKDLIYTENEHVYTLTPYFTFKKNNLSFFLQRFEKNRFMFLKRVIKYSFFIRVFMSFRKIWLIGEREYKAQDNGMVFYNYLRRNHPKINAYYVINKDSIENNNLKDKNNVLYFGSKKHILYTIAASRIISTHHPNYLYPSKMIMFEKKVKAKRIFLQHGVLATKNMVKNYGNYRNGFKVDQFLVSSNFEKDIVKKDLGYNDNQIHVTGLPRFDVLFNEDVPIKKQILVIPTWRDWITLENQFITSEFYINYKALLTCQRMKEITEKLNIRVVFCIHPNMQKYLDYFQIQHISIITQGEKNVQDLIKESALMITDYSSVGFDFSFLNKPVLYYQFDRERFLGKSGSHIDLDKRLPGDICFNQEDLIATLNSYIENNFCNKTINKMKSVKFLAYHDQNANDRTIEVVKKAKKSSKRITDNLLIKLIRVLAKKYLKNSN